MKKSEKSKKNKPLPVIEANRRREWRFDLPLPTTIEGRLPHGEKFMELTTIENISSGGAYLCLDSGLIVGSKVNLTIDLPHKLTGGKDIKLNLNGIAVRLEEAEKKGKKQGVAIRFTKDFHFIESGKKKRPE